jgi:hypothetical protein
MPVRMPSGQGQTARVGVQTVLWVNFSVGVLMCLGTWPLDGQGSTLILYEGCR